MQDLFNLFYLYDYMMKHAYTEAEQTEYFNLRKYVAKMIRDMGTE